MEAALRDEVRELRARFWSDRDPDGRAFAPLADAYRRAGELDEAAELVEEGTDRLPDFAPGHLVAARVLRDRGDRDGAGRAYRRVLELDSENVEALREAAVLAEEADRTGEAIELWQRAARLEPGREELRTHIRELKRRHYGVEALPIPGAGEEARPEAAEPDREAASAPRGGPRGGADEDDGPATEVYTRTMAELYVRQGLHDRAVEVFRRLLEERPDDEELRSRLEELEAGRDEAAGPPAEGDGPAPAAPASPLSAGAAPTGTDDEEVETLAQEWAAGPDATGELSTPFAWGDEQGTEREPADRPSISSYFGRMLGWGEASAEEDEVVPIEALAPDTGPVEESGP